MWIWWAQCFVLSSHERVFFSTQKEAKNGNFVFFVFRPGRFFLLILYLHDEWTKLTNTKRSRKRFGTYQSKKKEIALKLYILFWALKQTNFFRKCFVFITLFFCFVMLSSISVGCPKFPPPKKKKNRSCWKNKKKNIHWHTQKKCHPHYYRRFSLPLIYLQSLRAGSAKDLFRKKTSQSYVSVYR